MSDWDEPVEIGQVWKTKSSPDIQYVITRVSNNRAYHIRSNGDEHCFSDLSPGGMFLYCAGHSSIWYRDREAEKKTRATKATHTIPSNTTTNAPPNEDAITAFFKAVRPGRCPCNIPLYQCDYHRGY